MNAREASVLGQLLAYRTVLLLQGPNGPFFSRLRDALELAGVRVCKLNFNGGDDLFYRKGHVEHFGSPMTALEPFLRDLLAREEIEAIVVFGATRRPHRIATRLARELGIEVWAFEEGYFRPDYITLERGGVNADSPLAALTVDEIPQTGPVACRRRFPHAFRSMAWYSLCYFAAGMIAGRRYPRYRHHKPFGLHEAAAWLRAAWRKPLYRRRERPLVRALLGAEHPPFFLVALQVRSDSQIRVHSPWRRNEDFLAWVMCSFAAHAPPDTMLVVKHHPLDRGHADYRQAIDTLAARFGLAGRVVYVHDAHLPSLLQACDGLVTVNSTTGLQALHHRAPVIVLGRCFYDKPGLTTQGSLDAFWTRPGAVDLATYRRFRQYVIRTSQVNGSFYGNGGLLPWPEKAGAGWLRQVRLGLWVALLALVASARTPGWGLGALAGWMAQW